MVEVDCEYLHELHKWNSVTGVLWINKMSPLKIGDKVKQVVYINRDFIKRLTTFEFGGDFICDDYYISNVSKFLKFIHTKEKKVKLEADQIYKYYMIAEIFEMNVIAEKLYLIIKSFNAYDACHILVKYLKDIPEDIAEALFKTFYNDKDMVGYVINNPINSICNSPRLLAEILTVDDLVKIISKKDWSDEMKEYMKECNNNVYDLESGLLLVLLFFFDRFIPKLFNDDMPDKVKMDEFHKFVLEQLAHIDFKRIADLEPLEKICGYSNYYFDINNINVEYLRLVSNQKKNIIGNIAITEPQRFS